MRTLTRLLAAAVAAALVVGCSGTVDANVAATVDGTEIARDLLEDTVVLQVGNTSEMNAEERAEVGTYEREFLGFFIQDLVYERALDEAGVEVSEEELTSAIEAEIEALGGEDAYEERLTEFGVTVPLFEALVRLDARTAALRRHVAEDQPARAIRHILVETEEEANDILAELEDGADFGELAAEHSIDPGSADAGGEYPPAPRGQWVPEFDEAVWNAEVGEVVGPVETMHGFHVIEVLDETVLDPDEMAPELLDQLTAAEVGAILEEAFQAAEVEVASSIGTWDPAARQVVQEEVGTAPEGTPQLPTG